MKLLTITTIFFGICGVTNGQSCGLNQFYNTNTAQCECLPGFSEVDIGTCCGLNQFYNGNECQCVDGYTQELPNICCGPNESYNNVSSTCDCDPTFIRDPNTGSCDCPLYQTMYNAAIGCECMSGLYNDSTGHCCPLNERFNGNQCDCVPTMSRDANGICACLGLNEHYNNGQCECISGTSKLISGLCCGPHEYNLNGTCTCESGFIVDPQSDQCVCPFTQILGANNTCQCSIDYYRLPTSTVCCHKYEHEVSGACECLPGLIRNNISLQCMCPKNEYFHGQGCECITTFVRDPVSGMCCGPNEVGDGLGNCVCKPTFTFGPITQHCLCKPYSLIVNGSCVCDSGFIRNSTNDCVCPDGEILDSDACICNATKGYVRDPVTHLCGCGPHEIFINDFCQCAIGFVRNNITGQCQPYGGWTFEPTPVICANNATLLNCTYLIPYRRQNVTDAIQNLFGRIFTMVEWNHGNMNNIVVTFFHDIINIIGDPSQSLKAKIITFLANNILSCPYDWAVNSICSSINITLVSDMDSYLSSQQFGQELLAYPCPV